MITAANIVDNKIQCDQINAGVHPLWNRNFERETYLSVNHVIDRCTFGMDSADASITPSLIGIVLLSQFHSSISLSHRVVWSA